MRLTDATARHLGAGTLVPPPPPILSPGTLGLSASTALTMTSFTSARSAMALAATLLKRALGRQMRMRHLEAAMLSIVVNRY